MTEFFYDKTAEIKRQGYVGDKSGLVVVASSRAYLRPLSEEDAAANGFQFGQAFMLQTPPEFAIQKGDHVEVDGVSYTCSGVAKHDRLSIAHKRSILTLPQTN